MKESLRRHEVREAVRQSQEGQGKPIISAEFQGQRIVAAGSTLYWSPTETTQTFGDFLNNYIKQLISPEWGNTELKKPLEERHPILKWYHEIVTL